MGHKKKKIANCQKLVSQCCNFTRCYNARLVAWLNITFTSSQIILQQHIFQALPHSLGASPRILTASND